MLNSMLGMICLQEIAWHRLDELQPANDDVISRGITGLKLYMVAPFLA
jgi:mRNA-decapping enzyme subunit 2